MKRPDEDYEVGRGKPPKQHRFKPGRSGNPRGRPHGRHQEPPYDAVLGRQVAIRDNGVVRRVSAAEAFLLQLAKRGMEGDPVAARAAIKAMEDLRRHGLVSTKEQTLICWQIVDPGSVIGALEDLKLAEIKDPYSQENARVVLKHSLAKEAAKRTSIQIDQFD